MTINNKNNINIITFSLQMWETPSFHVTQQPAQSPVIDKLFIVCTINTQLATYQLVTVIAAYAGVVLRKIQNNLSLRSSYLSINCLHFAELLIQVYTWTFSTLYSGNLCKFLEKRLGINS